MQEFQNFGVPNLRLKKEEKYPDMGVLTMLPLEKKGGGRKIELNSKAIELLGIDTQDENNRIAFSFSPGTTKIYIANRTGEKTKSDIKVTKQESVSDKRYYEYIKKLLGFEVEGQEAVELKLTNVVGNYNNNPVYEVELLIEETGDINDTSTEVEEAVYDVESTDSIPDEEVAIPVDSSLIENNESNNPIIIDETSTENESSTMNGTNDFIESKTESPSFIAPNSNNPFI